MNIEIANNLVQLRKKNGLSQEALSEKLGLSRQAVSKWERAEASPDTDNLIALAKLYKVSLNELLMMDETTEETVEDGKNRPDNHNGQDDGTVNEEPPETENTKQDYVHIGRSGIHVKDKNSEVHIGLSGIHVNEKGVDVVDIDKNAGIIINGENYSLKKLNYWHKFPFAIIVVIAFLLLGMLMNLWHPAWLLFLTIPLYHSFVDAVAKRKPHHSAYPVLAVLAFLCLGFFGGFWDWCWIVFLTIPLYYCVFPSGREKDCHVCSFEPQE